MRVWSAVVWATAVTLVAVGALSWGAHAAFLPDPWAKIDQAYDVGVTPRVGLPLEDGDDLGVDIRVPSSGLGRVDLRFAIRDSRTVPEPTTRGDLKFQLTADGRELWSNVLAVGSVTSDEPVALTFPEVAMAAGVEVRLSMQLVGVPASVRIAPWEVPCNCSRMLTDYDLGDGAGLSGLVEPDASTYSYVDGRAERLQLALDRIDASNPVGFGRDALIAWSVASVLAVTTLFWILCFLLLRHEVGDFRRDAEAMKRRSKVD